MSGRKRVDIELSTVEYAHMQSALMTHAQLLHGHDAALALPAWAALSKLMGVPDARHVVSMQLPTLADAAALVAECEFELAKQRVAGRRGGAR